MKKTLENYFGVSFEELLKTREEFTFKEAISLQPKLSVRAMAYFNLAFEGFAESDEGYKEALGEEVQYLSGAW